LDEFRSKFLGFGAEEFWRWRVRNRSRAPSEDRLWENNDESRVTRIPVKVVPYAASYITTLAWFFLSFQFLLSNWIVGVLEASCSYPLEADGNRRGACSGRGEGRMASYGILLKPVATIESDLLVRTGQYEAKWMRE
jgi:hypothetical protein